MMKSLGDADKKQDNLLKNIIEFNDRKDQEPKQIERKKKLYI